MTIDTNILVDYLNGEQVAIQKINEWKEEGRALFISSISVTEVLALSVLTPAEVTNARAFLDRFLSTPFDNTIAETAAFIKRKYHFKFPDAGIAATALFRHTPLVTRDKQFLKIKEISVFVI